MGKIIQLYSAEHEESSRRVIDGDESLKERNGRGGREKVGEA